MRSRRPERLGTSAHERLAPRHERLHPPRTASPRHERHARHSSWGRAVHGAESPSAECRPAPAVRVTGQQRPHDGQRHEAVTNPTATNAMSAASVSLEDATRRVRRCSCAESQPMPESGWYERRDGECETDAKKRWQHSRSCHGRSSAVRPTPCDIDSASHRFGPRAQGKARRP